MGSLLEQFKAQRNQAGRGIDESYTYILEMMGSWDLYLPQPILIGPLYPLSSLIYISIFFVSLFICSMLKLF